MMLSNNPDQIAVWTEDGLDNTAANVDLQPEENGSLRIVAGAAPQAALTYIALRWNTMLPEGTRILGDHWERGYGDLEWRGFAPERPLPFYALLHEARGGETRGIGVETGAASFASWRVDERGVTLVLDVRCGGKGVQLGGRALTAATVRELASEPGETPYAFARRFCRALCPAPRLPAQPVYGGNDWYFRYGANTADTVRRESALIRELSPSLENAPTYVIDAGWAPAGCDGGPYEKTKDRLPGHGGPSRMDARQWCPPRHMGQAAADDERCSRSLAAAAGASEQRPARRVSGPVRSRGSGAGPGRHRPPAGLGLRPDQARFYDV